MEPPYHDSHAMMSTPVPRQVRLLWATIIAAPLLALGDLQVGYTLTLLACARGVRLLPLLSTGVAVVGAVLAIGYAHGFGGHGLERRRGVWPAGAEPVANGWVALMAIGLNLMALLVVIAMAVPRLVLDPCAR